MVLTEKTRVDQRRLVLMVSEICARGCRIGDAREGSAKRREGLVG